MSGLDDEIAALTEPGRFFGDILDADGPEAVIVVLSGHRTPRGRRPECRTGSGLGGVRRRTATGALVVGFRRGRTQRALRLSRLLVGGHGLRCGIVIEFRAYRGSCSRSHSKTDRRQTSPSSEH